MRKRYKNKKRSCGLCKPHKRGRVKVSEGKPKRIREEIIAKEIKKYETDHCCI